LQELVKEFLGRVTVPIRAGAFAVAGPVLEGRVKTTNLPWLIEEASLARDLGLDAVRLLNDLEAVARSVPNLQSQDLVTLNQGQAVAHGPIAVIAPGTGLGESFLTWDGARYVAHGSEGGHSDFAPTGERQIRLLQYLLKRHEHVGVERVCSGIGVPDIYEFLRDEERIAEPRDVSRQIAAASDRTKAIIDVGTDPHGASLLCRATVETLAEILASEAGNLALKVLATGGVYVAGGIALHILNELKSPQFKRAFHNKGRFEELMGRLPMHVITARAALLGAASFGLEQPWKS
jgi:glucokinase